MRQTQGPPGIRSLKRTRWPKGTYMKLKSGRTLRALMEQNGKSFADVGRFAGCHRTFVWQLATERRTTCLPAKAAKIAELLNVPIDVLFDPRVSTTDGQNGMQRKPVAA